MTDTSYASFDTLAENIRSNNQTAETYAFNFNSGGQTGANLTQSKIFKEVFMLIYQLGAVDYFYCTAKY
ncbi:MAG: hypothetical protein EOO43_17670, partial [Flavobacterium sp.]